MKATKEKKHLGKEQELLLSGIAPPLLKWYDANRRVLPWREEPAPYHVWVSEIMLQQTRVEAVKEYYARFLKELPTVKALAQAQEDVLLKLWEGLGYYNRVRNMQKAARIVVERYDGRIPSDYDSLLVLPGIGSYTAGAISSIAYGERNPAVDGNVMRVVTRILADGTDITAAFFKGQVEQSLKRVMPRERPGDFNQALMETGALVCLPNGMPDCGACPLAGLCRAKEAGNQLAYPVKAAKKPRRREEKTVLVLTGTGRIALHKRPETGLLAGMYEFPMLEEKCDEKQVLSLLKEQGLNPLRIRPLGEAKHIFSHVEWHMTGFEVRVDELKPFGERFGKENLIFVEIERAREEYAIPSAFAKYAREILIQGEKI